CGAVAVLLLVPALYFDAQVSYDAAAAGYPPQDRVAFVTGWPSGFGAQQLVDELAIFASDQRFVLLSDPNLDPYQVIVLASERHLDVDWTWLNDADAQDAQGFLSEGNPVPVGYGKFRLIWEYDRPRGGSPIKLYVKE